MGGKIKLEFRNICKSFPGVKALDDINLTLREGTIHVICGENGAGKSTLMKILNGIFAPDSGEIYIDGQLAKIKNPIDARNYGIGMVFQELSFIPDLTVEENVYCGRWPLTKRGRVDWKTIRTKTEEFLEQEGIHYKPTTLMRSLSTSDIQMIEILKAVSFNAKILIMDEPTSSISLKEADYLLAKLKELKERGVSILYISHKMDEVFRIADDITVLRDGAVIATHPAPELDVDSVITMMVGRKLDSQFPKEELPIGDIALEVEGYTQPGVFEDISFTVKRGEIVGFAGLVGAGRTETMMAVYGMGAHTSGTIKIHGKTVNVKRPSDAIRNGMIYVSEDRYRMGIIPCRNIQENVTVASLDRYFQNGYWNVKKENAEATEACDTMKVKASSYKDSIMSLSGGNQQKVILAKWWLCQPDILLMDEPTRGIDVGAKRLIYTQLTDFAREGKAVVMVSSELQELVGMCDRIYVMCEGRITGCLDRGEFEQDTIMRYAINSGTLCQ